jgi:uncharacterized protein
MKHLLIAFFVLGSILLAAQGPDNPLNSKRYIEITGTSETEFTPDEIYITITLQERSEKGEKLDILKQEQALRAGIKELGISPDNLTLSSADADFRKYRAFKKDVIIAKSYQLKISNAASLGQVYEMLDNINAYDAFVSKVHHSKMQEYLKENRVKAMKAGKDKADYLLAAIDQRAGQPIHVQEADNLIESPLPRHGMLAKSYSNAMYDKASEEPEMSFRKIKIRSSFLMKFEIISR